MDSRLEELFISIIHQSLRIILYQSLYYTWTFHTRTHLFSSHSFRFISKYWRLGENVVSLGESYLAIPTNTWCSHTSASSHLDFTCRTVYLIHLTLMWAREKERNRQNEPDTIWIIIEGSSRSEIPYYINKYVYICHITCPSY